MTQHNSSNTDAEQINLDHFFETDFSEYSEPDDVAAMREQVVILVDQLLAYRGRNDAASFRLNDLDEYLNKIRAIRKEMLAYEPVDDDTFAGDVPAGKVAL